MGCIFSSNDKTIKCPENYDIKKFNAVCMIFDELDFNGNHCVSTEDLSQGYDNNIVDFFSNRIDTLDNLVHINENIKKKQKILTLEKNKNELTNVSKKINGETELSKMDLDEKLELKKQQTKLQHQRLDKELEDFTNLIDIKKNNLDEDCKHQIEALHIELDNEFKNCEKYYQDKCNKLKLEKGHIENLLHSNDNNLIRLNFIQYLNNKQTDKTTFSIKDGLLYFQNKSVDETMLLLKTLNRNKFNYLNNN